MLQHHDLPGAYSHCYTISTHANNLIQQQDKNNICRHPFTSEIQTISWTVREKTNKQQQSTTVKNAY